MILLRKLHVVIACFFFPGGLSADERWDDGLKQLERSEMFESPIVGFEGVESDLWKSAERVFSRAPRDKALQLLNHENPVIRSYGYIFLSERFPKEEFFPHLVREIRTKDSVVTLIGDIESSRFLADIVYARMSKPLSDAQQSTVLDLLLRSDARFVLLKTALEEWGIPEELRSDFRRRAEKDIRFLLHVASWRQKMDQALIAKWHTYDRKEFWKAVAIYPAPEFLELIENSLSEIFEDQQRAWEARVYFTAVTSYNHSTSIPILKKALRMMELCDSKEERGFLSGLVEALKQRDANHYSEIEFRIWEEYNIVALNTWRRLIKLNPDRASDATVESLMDINVIRDEVTNSGEDVVPVMLKFSLSLAKRIRDPLLLHIVQTASYSRARFLQIIVPAYSRQWSNILLKRVATETNPHIFLPCAELLLSDPVADHTMKLRELQQEKEHLHTGWGGKRLDSILNQPKTNEAEQVGADQPATAPELKPERNSKPQPKSEVRSR